MCIKKITVMLFLICTTFSQPNYNEKLVPNYKLPNFSDEPLTKEAWEKQVRAQILAKFTQEVFGVIAAPPTEMTAKIYAEHQTLDGQAKRRQIKITCQHNGGKVVLDMLLYIPAKQTTKVPLFVALNFRGNQTIEDDKRITFHSIRTDQPRGSRKSFWDIESIIARGYGLATVNYFDIDPDYDDEFKNGIHACYPKLQNRNDNFSAISAWAWGLSRMVDYLQTLKEVDIKRLIVLGHSRLGKTALWAGANDQRFAMVISNNSGAGGAALSMRQFGERIHDLNTRFPHWFSKNFKNYNHKEQELPVDQHMLLALIAPRPLYIASASKDLWADPRGEFLAAKHANSIYKLYKSDGLQINDFPKVNTPSHGTIGYHVRDGEHRVTFYDWQQYLDFADHHLYNK